MLIISNTAKPPADKILQYRGRTWAGTGNKGANNLKDKRDYPKPPDPVHYKGVHLGSKKGEGNPRNS